MPSSLTVRSELPLLCTCAHTHIELYYDTRGVCILCCHDSMQLRMESGKEEGNWALGRPHPIQWHPSSKMTSDNVQCTVHV